MKAGKILTATNHRDLSGNTLHGDNAYVFYQIPVNAKKYSLVFLHGYGQSGKTWETTPDGRDGFQNIFLSRGYKVFIVDQPRRGRSGRSTVAGNISGQPDEQWSGLGNCYQIGQSQGSNRIGTGHISISGKRSASN